MAKKSVQGLTIIELVVTIGILAALSAIAFPIVYTNIRSSNTVETAARQVEADLNKAESIAVQQGSGDMVGGVLVRRSAFVVFSGPSQSYSIYTYEDTNGNGLRDAGEATLVTISTLPRSVSFGLAPGAIANGCTGGAAQTLLSWTSFGANGGPPGGTTPPGCGGTSACFEINSYGFPVPDSQNTTLVGGTVYLTDGRTTYGVTMNAAGLTALCKWPQGASGWVIAR